MERKHYNIGRYQQAIPVHVLRKIAGHGSLTTTQLYLHPDEQSINDAGNALSAHISAPAVPKSSPADCHLAHGYAVDLHILCRDGGIWTRDPLTSRHLRRRIMSQNLSLTCVGK